MEGHLGQFSQSPAALQLLGREQPEVRCSPWKEVTNMVYVQKNTIAQQTGRGIKYLLFCANHGWFNYFFKLYKMALKGLGKTLMDRYPLL